MDAYVQGNSDSLDASNGCVKKTITFQVSNSANHTVPQGQILVGGASAEFPSLRNAFFVGDQLIKRDCRLLQALAPNCRIVRPQPLMLAHHSAQPRLSSFTDKHVWYNGDPTSR